MKKTELTGNREADRKAAVDTAWKQERKLLLETGTGSGNWTYKQKKELFRTGKISGFEGKYDFNQEKLRILQTARGSRGWTLEHKQELIHTKRVRNFEGHHINSVKHYPFWARDPRNIRFLSKEEHRQSSQGHRGTGTRMETKGRLIDRERTLQSHIRSKETLNIIQRTQRNRNQFDKTPSVASETSRYLKEILTSDPISHLTKSNPNKGSWKSLSSFQNSARESALKTRVTEFRSVTSYQAYVKPGGIDLTLKDLPKVTAKDFGLSSQEDHVTCVAIDTVELETGKSSIRATLQLGGLENILLELPLDMSLEELKTLSNAALYGEGISFSCLVGLGRDLHLEMFGNIEGAVVCETLQEADCDLAGLAWGKNVYTQDLHVSPVESYPNPFLEELKYVEANPNVFDNFCQILLQPTLCITPDMEFRIDGQTCYVSTNKCPIAFSTRGQYVDYFGNTLFDDNFEMHLWWEPLLKDFASNWEKYVQAYPNFSRVAEYAKAVSFLNLCKKSFRTVLVQDPSFIALKTDIAKDVVDELPNEMSLLLKYRSELLYRHVLKEQDPQKRLNKLTMAYILLESQALKAECCFAILDTALFQRSSHYSSDNRAELERKQHIGKALRDLSWICAQSDPEALAYISNITNTEPEAASVKLLGSSIQVLSEVGDLANVIYAVDLLRAMFGFCNEASCKPTVKLPVDYKELWLRFFRALQRKNLQQAEKELDNIRASYLQEYSSWNKEQLEAMERECDIGIDSNRLQACHRYLEALEALPAGLDQENIAKKSVIIYKKICALTRDPFQKKTWQAKIDYWNRIALEERDKKGNVAKENRQNRCNMF